jgi:hypothetical protein
MARTTRQTGRVPVVSGRRRGDLRDWERHLERMGCRDIQIDVSAEHDYERREIMRAFVLTVPYSEYSAVFPSLDGTNSDRRNSKATMEAEERESKL